MGIFLTGAGGFVGKQLVTRLIQDTPDTLYCLIRSGKSAWQPSIEHPRIVIVEGNLSDREAYSEYLAQCQTVVHLAAVTGKAGPQEFMQVNLHGTSSLLQQCKAAGVTQFLFVSTIAVTFVDKLRYYYAQSKEQAEQCVRESGLKYVIIRPTLIAGRGAKAWEGLLKLARLPVLLVPGDGTPKLQPIHVDDLVRLISGILSQKSFDQQTIEAAGSEQISISDLLTRMHIQYSGRKPVGILRIPLRWIVPLLTLIETIIGPVLPITVGQLASFKNDGIAKDVGLIGQLVNRKTIDQMILETCERTHAVAR